jgi:hypothetical protein
MSLEYDMYCDKCDAVKPHQFEVSNEYMVIAVCECGNVIQYWRNAEQ